MNTGQTMLTLGAFVLLSTIMLTFYRLLAESGQTMDSAQGGITAVALATSYTQYAQGLAFDEMTLDSFVTQADIGHLTDPASLGRDSQFGPDFPADASRPRENVVTYFDDIDDFNGESLRDTTLVGPLAGYRTSFTVYYVKPDSVDRRSLVRTFVKRMDLRIWRESPPSTDTLRTTTVFGYWLFSNAL